MATADEQMRFAASSSEWTIVDQVRGEFRDPFNRRVVNALVVRADSGANYYVGRGFAKKYLKAKWDYERI